MNPKNFVEWDCPFCGETHDKEVEFRTTHMSLFCPTTRIFFVSSVNRFDADGFPLEMPTASFLFGVSLP